MDEKYLLAKAKEGKDPSEAKAWIITAKLLYPRNFYVQFEAYEIEKASGNFEQAAECFSYLVNTFNNQQHELLVEISNLQNAFQMPSCDSPENEFYINMFKFISYEVQHKILLLTSHTDSGYDQCKLILLLLKRFPKAIQSHAPRLLETLLNGIDSHCSSQFREILIQEALPLILKSDTPPEIPNVFVHRILSIGLEFYLLQMFSEKEEKAYLVDENWVKIFEILEICGKMLKWEPFLPYVKTYSKDIYWQKLIQLISQNARQSECKQIMFCTTIVFILSLQDYINSISYKIRETDSEIQFVLIPALTSFTDIAIKKRKLDEAPHISVHPPCPPTTSSSFLTALRCWQFLNGNELINMDFSRIVMTLPLNSWLNRFLMDLNVYTGEMCESSFSLIQDNTSIGQVEKNIRFLSLTVNNIMSTQVFERILAIVSELPHINGSFINTMVKPQSQAKQFILLPITKKAILQYCVTILINALKIKLQNYGSVSNSVLGNLLVLLQLDWNQDTYLLETIFDIIRNRRSFSYLLFPSYIINVDTVEEFMAMWRSGDVKLEFSTPQSAGQRRIGTRGADKGYKEDFKQIIKQQVLRCNEDIVGLIIQFIQQEHSTLHQNLFDV